MSEPAALKPEGRPQMPLWQLEVVEAFDVTPRMRRVVFTGDLEAMAYMPGQAIVMAIPLPEGGTGRRDYTIRSLDKASRRMAVDFVLHGSSPAPTFARNARPGDTIMARGPRGRTVFNPAADWYLFCGDETCLPAILHILETIDQRAAIHAFIEIDGLADRQPVPEAFAAAVTWIERGGAPAGPNSLILDRLAAFDLPEGRGHACLIGETSNVRAQRHHLIARGFSREQISSEGYWRPGRVGGHDHVED